MGKQPHKHRDLLGKGHLCTVMTYYPAWSLTPTPEVKLRVHPLPLPEGQTLFLGIPLSVWLHIINILVKLQNKCTTTTTIIITTVSHHTFHPVCQESLTNPSMVPFLGALKGDEPKCLMSDMGLPHYLIIPYPQIQCWSTSSTSPSRHFKRMLSKCRM